MNTLVPGVRDLAWEGAIPFGVVVEYPYHRTQHL